MFGAGCQVMTTMEMADNLRSQPPRSFGFKAAGEFQETALGEARVWTLARSDWEASPAFREAIMPLAAIGVFWRRRAGPPRLARWGPSPAPPWPPAPTKAVNAQTAAANTNNQLQRDLYESNKNLLNPYVQDGRDASSPWRTSLDFRATVSEATRRLTPSSILPATRTR